MVLVAGCARSAFAFGPPPPCGGAQAPAQPARWKAISDLPVPAYLGSHAEAPSLAFERLLGRPETVKALKGTATASRQPLPVVEVPDGKLDPARARRLAELERALRAAWKDLVSDVDARLGREAKGEADPTPATPELAAIRKALGKDAAIADRYAAEMRKRRAPESATKLAALHKNPTAAAYLTHARGWQDNPKFAAFRDAYVAYAGTLAAWKAGGDVERDPGGDVTRVRYPDGTTMTPTYDEGELVGYELRSPKGLVRFYRRDESKVRGWESGGSKSGRMIADADDVELEADGSLVRTVGTTKEILRPDGTVTTIQRSGKVLVSDLTGRVLAVGEDKLPPAQWTRVERDGTGRIVRIVDPRNKREIVRTKDGLEVNGRPFEGDVAVSGDEIVLVPNEPKAKPVLTFKLLRIIGGVPKIHVLQKGGRYVESQDEADKKVLASMKGLKVSDNVVGIKRPPRELGDKPVYDLSKNPFVKKLIDGGIASPGHEITVGDSRRKWDPRKPGGVGEIENPSIEFTTEREETFVELRVISARTGRERKIALPKVDYDALKKLYDDAKAKGRIPQTEGFPAFYARHTRLTLARYEATDKALFAAMRALIGDSKMLELGYRDPALTTDKKTGLLQQLDGRIFFDDNKEKRFASVIKSRALLLSRKMAVAARQSKERLALARLGKWAELQKLEEKEGAIGIDTVIGLTNGFAEGLPTEADQPNVIRFLGAVKTGVRRSVQGLVMAPFEDPLMTGGLVTLGFINPAAATLVAAGMILPSALTTITQGLDTMIKAEAAGDDEAYWKGLAMVVNGTADAAVVIVPVLLESARSGRGAPKAPAEPVKPSELSVKDLQKSLSGGHPEVLRQIEAGGEPVARRVLDAWEHTAKRANAPLSAEFQARLREARAAYNELAKRNGWKGGPAATEPIPGAAAVPPVEVPTAKAKTEKTPLEPLTSKQLGAVEKTLGGEGKLEGLPKEGLEMAKGNGNLELLHEVRRATLSAEAEVAKARGKGAADVAAANRRAAALRERALQKLRDYALENTGRKPLERGERKALEKLADGDAKALEGLGEAAKNGQHQELRRLLLEAKELGAGAAKKLVVERLRGMKNAFEQWRNDPKARAAEARTLIDEARNERGQTDGKKYIDGKGRGRRGKRWWQNRQGEIPTSEKALLEEAKTGRPTYTKPKTGRGRPTWHAQKILQSIENLRGKVAELKRILNEVKGLEGADPGVTKAIENEIARSEARIKSLQDAIDVWDRRSAQNPGAWDDGGHSKRLRPGEPQHDDPRGGSGDE